MKDHALFMMRRRLRLSRGPVILFRYVKRGMYYAATISVTVFGVRHFELYPFVCTQEVGQIKDLVG